MSLWKSCNTSIVHNSTMLRCTSPASAVYTGGAVSFGISNAAENVSETQNVFVFTYQPTITLDHAIPSLVPTNGRKSIEVVGAHLICLAM